MVKITTPITREWIAADERRLELPVATTRRTGQGAGDRPGP
jgi:hypothetical protein